MKISKLLGIALAMVAFGALPLSAQNADDKTQDEQIKQLEKELRILELQKQVEQAKSNTNTEPQKALSAPPQDNKTKEPSGFMLGAGLALGYTFAYIETYETAIGSYEIDNSRFEYGGELLLGYKWFFGERGIFGMRLYGRYDFLFSTANGNPVNAHNGSLNYDLMFNFNQHRPFKAGMFFGLNFGGGVTNYQYDRMCSNNYAEGGGMPYGPAPTWEACDTSEDNLTIGGNFGLRFVIFDKNAIELAIQPRLDFWYGNLQVLGFARYIYTF